MLIREKIAYLLDILHVKHEVISHQLGITRQAFSKRLKSGNFTDLEVEIIAKQLNMTKANIDNINPKKVVDAILGNQPNDNNIVLSYVMNFTISERNEDSAQKLVTLIKELGELEK